MNLFIAGGTGVVGRALLPLLAGHAVQVVARSSGSAGMVTAAGATPVAPGASMQGCDAVIDLTTHVPPLMKAGNRASWAEHDRLRDAGSAATVAAADAAGVPRVIRDSVAFIHADGGTVWLDETSPTDPGAGLASAAAAEAHVTGFTGAGVVLRFGLLYGPTASDDAVSLMRRFRRSPLLGPPDAYLAQLYVTDAAAAVVAALTAPAGVYDVVDEPRTRAELLRVQAAALGYRRVRQLPGFVARGEMAQSQLRSLRISTAKLHAATGWAPAVTAEQGWAAIAAAV